MSAPALAPRVTPPSADVCVAYHEAAHGVIGVYYALPVARLAILADAAPDEPRGYVMGDDASWPAAAADAQPVDIRRDPWTPVCPGCDQSVRPQH